MKRYPANMADFMDMFPTEDACLEYLSIVRWPDGYKCLRCGKGDYWKKARGLFTCRACGYEASVLAGPLFQDTHKPLRLWFQAMWYVVNQKNGAAFSVLLFHSGAGFASHHNAPRFIVNTLENGYLGVSIFFMLSGFILTYNYYNRLELSRGGLLEFAVSRFARIYPVYIFFLIIILPLSMDKLYFSDACRVLLMVQSWTLPA